MRKLLSGILLITLCSCGTSFKALEQETINSEKHSIRDYYVAVDSVTQKYSDKVLAKELEYFHSFNREHYKAYLDSLEDEGIIRNASSYYPLGRNSHRTDRRGLRMYRDLTYKTIEIEILPKERVNEYYGRSNLSDAYWSAIDSLEVKWPWKYVYAEEKSIFKRMRNGEFAFNLDFLKGLDFANALLSTMRGGNKFESPEAARFYLKLKSEHPLNEQSEMFIYGVICSSYFPIIFPKKPKLFAFLYPSNLRQLSFFD
jgi:hypothetical protein